HHAGDQVVVGEVAEPMEQEESHHRRDQQGGQAGVAGDDGIVQESPQEERLERDERRRRRLGEDDEEGLPPVRPEVAGGRPEEVQHGGGSYAFLAATHASIRASSTSRGRAPRPSTSSWKSRRSKRSPRVAAARDRSWLILSSPIL